VRNARLINGYQNRENPRKYCNEEKKTSSFPCSILWERRAIGGKNKIRERESVKNRPIVPLQKPNKVHIIQALLSLL
jgi:hypothetical protein